MPQPSDGQLHSLNYNEVTEDHSLPDRGIGTVGARVLVHNRGYESLRTQSDDDQTFAMQSRHTYRARVERSSAEIELAKLVSYQDLDGQSAEIMRSKEANPDNALPDFNVSDGTRKACIATVCISAVVAVICISIGIATMAKYPGYLLSKDLYFYEDGKYEVVTLLINILLTICMEGMGFVHSVSLRWALYREGRLDFNTNLRLFTNAKMHGPNRWYINFIWILSIIICYVATTLLFTKISVCYLNSSYQDDTESDEDCMDKNIYGLNGMALCFLGIGLALEVVISAWCLLDARDPKRVVIPTWNSTALNSTLTAIHYGYTMPQAGRCIMSVHHQKLAPTFDHGLYPVSRQGTLWRAHRGVRWVMRLLFFLVICSIAWPITIYYSINFVILVHQGCRGQLSTFSLQWGLMSSGRCDDNIAQNYADLVLFTYNGDMTTTVPYAGQLILFFLIVAAIQGMQTIGLHCTELLVNLSRDETAWRRASHRNLGGAYVSYEPFVSAASSWENIVLFLAKAMLHWFMGQSMSMAASHSLYNYDFWQDPRRRVLQMEMIYSRLVWYAVSSVVVFILALYVAFKKPRGPQPAAFGHIQTLADLIDDWKTDEKGRFWWGDKTSIRVDRGGIRHAGTSCNKERLSLIHLHEKYL